MRLILLYSALLFPFCGFCRDAIEFFVKHKKIQHIFINILRNSDNFTKNWIEYKYVFDNNLKILNDVLRVGVYLHNNDFDCRFNNGSGTFEGYSIDITQILKESLNVSVHFIPIENLHDLMSSVNTTDLIICHFHNADTTYFSTSYPTLKDKLLLVYKPDKLNFTKDIFILTFAGLLWLIFVILMILLAVCLRISTIQYSIIKPKYEVWTWVEITLWAIAAACQQGLSNTPSGFASCCLFFLGYLMAYLLYTGLAAAITSVLVQHDIDTNSLIENIKFEKLHLISLECVRFHISNFKKQFFKTEYVNDFYKLFDGLNKDNYVGIGPSVLIQQFMVNNFNDEQISSYLTLNLNITYNEGFLILDNNPWKKLINKKLLIMDYSGILQNTLKRHLKENEMFGFNSGYSSVGQEHVGSATLLFLGGFLASTLFLMAEFVLYFYKKGRKKLIVFKN